MDAQQLESLATDSSTPPLVAAEVVSAKWFWTVCDTCAGEGRVRRKHWSKKARFKQQQQQQPKEYATAAGTPPRRTPPPTDVCKACQGTGLQREAQTQTTAHADDEESFPDASGDASLLLSNTYRRNPPPLLPSQRRRVLNVAVIGGGIGGLAFAAACQHRGLSVTVYERDSTFLERKQGYGLTLQQAASQLAALGISTPLSSGITSTKHIVHDERGNVKGTWGMRHWQQNENNGSNNMGDADGEATPCVRKLARGNIDEAAATSLLQTNEIDEADDGSLKRRKNKRQNVHIARQALRYELLKAATAAESCRLQQVAAIAETAAATTTIDPSSSVIQWGHRLVHHQEMDDHVQLTFFVDDENGATRTVQRRADIVVGADGIRSQVRQQLIGTENDIPLRYLGCIVILGICPLASVVNAQSSLLDGETVFQTADGTTRVYMMPYSKTEYMWQLSFPVSEAEAAVLSSRGPAALQQEALLRCGAWHSPVPDILSATPVDLVSGYPVYDRAILQPKDLERSCKDSNRPRRVTCLGDAIHCMSPFKGQGANQALLDALSLARSLYKALRSASAKDATPSAQHGTTSSAPKMSAVDIEQAILHYEAEMLERSAAKVKASADAAYFLHTDIAIQEGNVTRGAAAAASHEAAKEATKL